MAKEDKMTTDDLGAMMARRFDDLDGKINHLDGKIDHLEFKIEDTERRLSKKIDHVDEKLDALEEVSIRPLEERISIMEKANKQTKQKHG